MARRVLKWVSPIGLANTGALVFAVVGFLLFLLAGAAMLFEMFFRSASGPPGIGSGEVAMFALLPVFYAAFGWLLGYLVATIFNRLSRYTGGLSVDVSEEAEPASAASRASAPDGADRSSLPDAIG